MHLGPIDERTKRWKERLSQRLCCKKSKRSPRHESSLSYYCLHAPHIYRSACAFHIQAVEPQQYDARSGGRYGPEGTPDGEYG